MNSALAGDSDQMIEDRSADAATTQTLCGVHRLQLRMAVIQLLERPDPEEVAVASEAEEGDGRVEEALDF